MKMNNFICIYCNKSFESLQKNRIYCSRSCSTSSRNKKNKGKKRSKICIEKQRKSSEFFWQSEKGQEEKHNRSIRAKIQSNKSKYKKIFKEAIEKFKNDPKKLSASYDKKIKTIKEKVLNGTWNTWKTRNIKSYPELFVENFLLSNKIIFEREKYISKKSLGINERNGFFLDFFFKDKKINLEIDGSQHLKPDRLKKDVYRDNLLILNGYKIIHIPWVNIKNKEKQKWFLNQLNELIKILS